jgi:transposase-like protein
METTMNQDKLKALAAELAKDLKTPADLNALSAQLTKLTVEAALNAEMSEHLGYAPYEAKGRQNTNSRNGYSFKTLKGDHGEIELDTPRDRDGSFEPQLVRKGQTRITGMDDQILMHIPAHREHPFWTNVNTISGST